MLRLTPAITLMLLPLALTRLLAFHKRVRAPSSILSPHARGDDAERVSARVVLWFSVLYRGTEFTQCCDDGHVRNKGVALGSRSGAFC